MESQGAGGGCAPGQARLQFCPAVVLGLCNLDQPQLPVASEQFHGVAWGNFREVSWQPEYF